MSEVSLEDRAQALENDYFRRKEQELIGRMKAKLGENSTRPTAVKCPKCDGSLHAAAYENVKVEMCDRCHGAWFDAGELAQISHHEEKTGSWFGRWFG